MSALVGVIGRKRAGKDSFAARLVEAHGFRRLAFADALRDAALALDPIVTPVDTVAGSVRLSELVAQVGWEGAKAHTEVRRTLQRFGQGVRLVDEDFWLRPVLAQVDAEPDRPTVITDVRYPNEAAAVVERGGVIVRMVRPGLGHDEADTHESETALADFRADWVVFNNTTLEHVYEKADHFASCIRTE